MGIREVLIGDWTFRQLKRHYSFENEEIRDFHISVFLMSLIFFFFIWAFTSLTITTGIIMWIYSWLICAGSLFAFISVPKLGAIMRGNKVKYEGWTNGLLIGFIVSFLSYGLIPLMTPGALDIQPIERLKHGKRFHYESRKDMYVIWMLAPLTSVAIALIAQGLYFATNIEFILYISMFNALIAFFSMLPLTKNIGIFLFYMKKRIYLPMTVALFCFMIMVIMRSKYAFMAGILGLIIGTIFPKKIKFIEHIMK